VDVTRNDTGGGGSAPTFKYWAFISYSHADTVWSSWLHKALERYRVPRQIVGRETPSGKVPSRLFPIFRDRDELPGGSSLDAAVAESLAQSRFLIVVCSPHAAASRYVNQEIVSFKRHGREDRVLCLIVDGEPGAAARPDSGLLEAFPPALRQEIATDGVPTGALTEPLAADVRPGKDGKQNARLKLLAGMLGVGYDELRQRERRRHRWRIVQAAAAAILIVGITAGIWWNRQRVVEQQRVRAQASDLASASLTVTDKEADRRLSLALQSVRLTREPFGYVLPESEIALHRALTDAGLRGSFVENDTSDTFGGWTWPAAFSRDGSRIVAPSALGPTLLLDADANKQGVLVDRETPYEHDLVAIASRDGRHFITGGADGVVRTWTLDGKLVSRFRAHEADILTLDENADGTALLTVGCDKDPGHQSCGTRSARLWTVAGEPRAAFVHEPGSVTSAAFSPTGARIVTAGEDSLRSWLPSGEPVFSVTGGAHWVRPEGFSKDGTRLLTGACAPYLHAGMFSPLPPDSCPERSSRDATMKVYNEHGELLSTIKGWLAALQQEGRRIAAASLDCSSQGDCKSGLDLRQLLDDRQRRELNFKGDIAVTSTGLRVDGTVEDIAFSRDGEFFVVGLEHGAIELRDLGGRVVSQLGGFVTGLTSARFSDDGDRLVTVSCSNPHQGACLERSIHVWDPNGPLLKSLPHSPGINAAAAGRNSQPSVMRMSPSGTFLFVATETESPNIRNLSTGERVDVRDAGLVLDAAFDPAERRIATFGEQNVRFYDLRGQPIEQLQDLSQTQSPYMPTAAWTRGIVRGSGALVRAWNWDGKPIGDMKAHRASVTFVAASPTDDAVATIDVSGRAILWGEQLNQTSEIDASAINRPPDGGWETKRFDTGYKVRFTPDATRLVILGPGNLSMWTRTGKKLWDVAVDAEDDVPPEVSVDRVLVAVCGERGRGASLGSLRMCYDSTATLWDFEGTQVKRLDAGVADENRVHAAAFNPRGNRVVTLDRNGVARLWDAHGNLITALFVNASAVRFDSKGGRLLTVQDSGPVHIWQVWDDLEAMIAEAERRSRRLQAGAPSK
jgi:WD40 repeat protein